MSWDEHERQAAQRQELIEYTAGRIAGESPHAAALAATGSPTRARNATKVMEPRAKSLIRDYLDEHGATDADVAAAIGRALRAKKVAKDGTVLDDAQAQLAAGRFVAEIKGQLRVAGADAGGMTITLSGPMVERFIAAREQGTMMDAASEPDYIDALPASPPDPAL